MSFQQLVFSLFFRLCSFLGCPNNRKATTLRDTVKRVVWVVWVDSRNGAGCNAIFVERNKNAQRQATTENWMSTTAAGINRNCH